MTYEEFKHIFNIYEKAVADIEKGFLKKSLAIHKTLTDKLDTYVGETNV